MTKKGPFFPFFFTIHEKGNSRKTWKLANLTQLDILVVSYDEDNVGPDVSAVSLDATPQALSPGGGEGPAAWKPVQRQQGHPSQPLHQHGSRNNKRQGGYRGGLMEKWREGEEVQPGHRLTPVQRSQPWLTMKRQREKNTRSHYNNEKKWVISK